MTKTSSEKAKAIIAAIKENWDKPEFSWFDYETQIVCAIEETEEELLQENAYLKAKIRYLEKRDLTCPYCGNKTLRYILEENCTYAVCGFDPCGLKDFVGYGDLREKI